MRYVRAAEDQPSSNSALFNLDQVTAKLGHEYRLWKSAEKAKDRFKKEFFSLIDDQVSSDLVTKIVLIEKTKVINNTVKAVDYAEKYHPGWFVEFIRDHEDGWEVELQEDPSYRSYLYVNEKDEMVYSRSVSMGSIQLDIDRLEIEDPNLFSQITYIPEPERKVKDLEDLDEVTLAHLQDYIFEGKPVVKLLAPRKAKPEELDG